MKKALSIVLGALTLCSCASAQADSLASSCGESPTPGESVFSSSSEEGIKHTVRFILDGEVIKTLVVEDGRKLNAPSSDELPKGGYIIEYWYVQEGNLESPWPFSEGAVTSDLDLLAKFEYETYQVKLIFPDGDVGACAAIAYKQAYDFSNYYSGKADHLENEHGDSFPVSGTWLTAHDETLAPFFSAQAISYGYYELLAPLEEESNALTSKEELRGVANPNPISLFGKPSSLNVSLKDPFKEGYRFEGWYSLEKQGEQGDGLIWSRQKIDALLDGYFGTRICALFSKRYSLSIEVNDANAGKAEFVGGKVDSACIGDSISLRATPAGDWLFRGWYDGGSLVSGSLDYAFSMPAKDCVLSAVFWTKRQSLGIDPFIDSSHGLLTYGLYPQEHVSDEGVVASLNAISSPEANGWYLLGGEYYAKAKATPYRSSYRFDDGASIASGREYWFKCEPIAWRILSASDGSYSLVSSLLLDARRYDDSSNDYGGSEIRGWLNGGFYDSAFSLGDSIVELSNIDNSGATTDSSSNPQACGSVEDKVYLLSYQDYMDPSLFADAEARQCQATDWAKANGAWCNPSSSGWYWTRSPYSPYAAYAWGVNGYGAVYYYYYVSFSCYAVRPAIAIKPA